MPSRKKLDVFLSSAQEEFENERKALSKKISKLSFLDCVPLEERGADALSVEESSIESVRECDIYVGIFGSRYSELVIKEFREAVKRRKLCLNYVKEVAKRDAKLQDFIQIELKGQFKYHEFRSTKDLYTKVKTNLLQQLDRLLRMGLGQFKDSKKQAFEKQTQMRPTLNKAIKEKEEDRPLSIIDEAIMSFRQDDFVGATVKAAIAVELAARLALNRAQVPSRETRKATLGRILRLLNNYEILEMKDARNLQELIYLRNAIIHEGKTPTRVTTKRILKIARDIVGKLARARAIPIKVKKRSLEDKLVELEKRTGYYPSMTIDLDKAMRIFYETISQTTKEVQKEIIAVFESIWNTFPEKEIVILTINRTHDPRGTVGARNPEIITVVSKREEFEKYRQETIGERELWANLVFYRKIAIDQFNKIREKFNWPLAL